MNGSKLSLVGLTNCMLLIPAGEIRATDGYPSSAPPAGAGKSDDQNEFLINPDVNTKAPHSGNGIWGLLFCNQMLSVKDTTL